MAHRYRVGDEPEDVDYAIEDMRGLRREMRHRTKVIRELGETDPVRCPENKVTPELAADKRLGLHPVVIAADECQVWFEHPQPKDEFETICTDLVKRGSALSILIMLATQQPDAKSIPTGISANAVLRLCLKVQDQIENDMVLGTSQYKAGIRTTMFFFDDRGVAYFAGEGAAPRIIRAQGFDLRSLRRPASFARAISCALPPGHHRCSTWRVLAKCWPVAAPGGAEPGPRLGRQGRPGGAGRKLDEAGSVRIKPLNGLHETDRIDQLAAAFGIPVAAA